MARPDWGALQKQFLADHAKTNISPKDWCEARDINYATARRYIKKVSAQSDAQPAQNKVRKSVRSAQVKKSADELIEDETLTAQQKLFVIEYLKDNNATQAASRAGYSDASYGRQLITLPHVERVIAQQQKESAQRALISADEVLETMWQLATFDANEISQHRIGCCRYCWGFGHNYQWRDMVEFEEERLKAVERKKPEPQDPGGFGYNSTKPPNQECPRCDGLGVSRPHLQDSRKLDAVAKLAYSGTRIGKNGIEILSISRERMFEAVAKRMGLADSQFAQKLQELEIERRQLEIDRLRKEIDKDKDSGLSHNIMPVPSCDSVDDWEQAAQKQQRGVLGE
ncbi:Terminase small subunit [Serratia proteamaculans]|uniref:terminase small subunit n=1 Tax=Serratia proteamaculans TaxID=28151 RepID=UPI0021771A15|nr:terminase small subunit [Serratia proteamaculans]CAI0726510.1 Terminase small subunit [Serratia proteamaculans]CAI1522237.1 Terminase small subunit [Serratia proteamaculans]